MSLEQTIVEIFEDQASNTPQAIALTFEDQHLTYAQLNRRANQLAHFLEKLGVGQETMVGVFMERSLEMVISLYGILKAGGAYVPLDPEYPQERIIFMLEDTQVPVLLTQERLMKKLSKAQNSGSRSLKQEIICVDSNWKTIAQESSVNPTNRATAENLAYVIYTSGSTGRPKGVMNEHVGICNRLLWMQEAYSLTQADRVLQKTPFSFDVSVWEFFWPLMFGARLVVAKPGGHKDTRYLVELIVEQAITTIHFVPSMLQLFLLDENVETCQSLKRVICSGEALPYNLQERFFARLEAELHNLYGPTEAAVDVTYWACQRQSQLSTVPIGRPVSNTQIYLLDPQLQPVQIGEPGELHIGGVQVARGYLNRPNLTKEKFILDPFSSDPNARLYKTGDLARSLPDGNILYLGRLDYQVQIHGIRIEMGEIEATLSQHPSVKETVVVAHEYAPSDQRLVAYVTLKEENYPTISEWRHFLSQKLPHYMVPSAFVVVNQFPLTPNGKIDRKALPIPEFDRSNLSSDFEPPRNATEENLVNIWATVFNLEKVGIHDNFFDLGGDSIISIQIIARAEQAGLRFTSQQVFDCGTIAKLASEVQVVAGTQVEQGPVTGPTLLTPPQCWFFGQGLPEPDAWNMSIILDASEDINPELLNQAFQQLLVHHDGLRNYFLSDETPTGWQQVAAESAPPPTLQVVNLDGLSELEQEALVEQTIAQLEAGHNLAEGRLIGVAYFSGAASQSNRLFITLHHLVVDDYSWNILLQDLETLYAQLSRGEAAFLPAKTLSLKTWADRLTDLAQTNKLKQELTHWLSVFEGVQPDVPLDIPDGENSESSKEMVIVSLGAAETKSLLNEVPNVYNAQLNDILLTALARTFCSWIGQPSLLITMEGHGREDVLENRSAPARTLGWFTSMFPVKLTLPNTIDPGGQLKAIKEQLRAVPNKGIGYGLLRYLCRDETINRRLARMKSPQILFNYLGQWDKVLPKAATFRMRHAPIGWHGARNSRAYALEVSTWIIDGRLQVNLIYSNNLHHRETIQLLAEQYMVALEAIINHCLSPDAGGFTPSDFPLANLDEKKLDQLADILNKQE